MKTVKDFQTAQLAINELFEFKNRLETLNTDLSGRRFTNVGGAQDRNEFCTLYQLEQIRDSLLAKLEELNKKISHFDSKIGALLKKIEELEGQLSELSQAVAGIDSRVSELEDA